MAPPEMNSAPFTHACPLLVSLRIRKYARRNCLMPHAMDEKNTCLVDAHDSHQYLVPRTAQGLIDPILLARTSYLRSRLMRPSK